MIGLLSRLALGAGLATWLASAADLPDRWRAWRYSRPVVEPASADNTESPRPAEITVPWEVFAHCNAGCGDLRITDAQGLEVPYQLKTEHATSRSSSREVRVVENSFAAGKYTQVVGDLGADAPFYDRVRLETPRSDFIAWAEVALSEDAKTWRIVEPRAPIARFRTRSVDGTQTIPFRGLNSRYIRVRIFETDEPFSVTGLTVLREEAHPATLAAVPAVFQLANSDDTTETAWTTDLASSRIPVSQLRFSTETSEFYRAVRIRGSEDGKIWGYRGSGVIYRYKQGNTIRESLSVDLPEWPLSRLLRAEVINGNDQPLRNAKLALFAVPRTLLFRVRPEASYRLLYGNERAGSPQYDLGHYLEAGPAKPVYSSLALGPEEATANYRDPRPFSEQHPSLLWISLGIAVVLIGLTALKTLRAPSPPEPPNPS
jgi:Protein of unknown function (DUF3999)